MERIFPYVLELPGGSATIGDPTKVTERKRRPIQRAMFGLLAGQDASSLVAAYEADQAGDAEGIAQAVSAVGPNSLEAADALNDALVAAVVVSWTFKQPDDTALPVTAEGVQDLPGDVYDRLREECGPFIKALMPSFIDAPQDRRSPTPL